MSLKILKFESGVGRLVLIASAILCVAGAWYFAKWNFANATSLRLDTTIPESKFFAEWLTQIAPDDPQPHHATAVLFEKTFEPDDLIRSLTEYETAAALTPNNYIVWLNLGQARDRSGDSSGAEAAFRRAAELAPTYATVQWAYGNSLIRHKKTDEGFAIMAKAAAADPQYSNPAASIALQIFDGNIGEARRVLGDSAYTNAALANNLALQKLYDEAYDAWARLDAEDKAAKFKETGQTLQTLFTDAKKFRLAASVKGDLLSDGNEKPAIGQISNGGFESGVKLRDAGIFEWQIVEGAEPQIGLSEALKHSGKYSLWMTFNTFEAAAFRPVYQTVAVIPGAAYEFTVLYRADLKTAAAFKWEILDAASATRIAATDPLALAGDWTTLKVNFTVTATSDGVIIKFIREGCGSGACPVTGKLSFDDISIRQL